MVAVEYIELIAFEDGKYKYKILDYADEIVNGNIQWKNLNKTWIVNDETEDLYFVEDEGEINAYNKDGDLIHSN